MTNENAWFKDALEAAAQRRAQRNGVLRELMMPRSALRSDVKPESRDGQGVDVSEGPSMNDLIRAQRRGS